MSFLRGGSIVVLVYWVYDFFFFFLVVGLLVVVVCRATVVEWRCWGFLFLLVVAGLSFFFFDFLLWVLCLICG